MEQTVFEPRHRAELRLAQCGGARYNRLEHRLYVGWGARDHAQDLARRELLRQSLVALRSALVELSPERGNCLPMIDRPVVQRCHLIASSTQMPIAHVLRARIPVRHPPRQRCCALLGL